MSYRLSEGYSISSEQFHIGSGYKFFSTKQQSRTHFLENFFENYGYTIVLLVFIHELQHDSVNR